MQAQHDSLVATLVEKHKRELCAVKLEAECLLMKHTQTHQAAAVAARIRAENTVALASSAQVSHQEALRAQQTEAEARMQSCQEAANALASTMQVSMALALKEVEEEQVSCLKLSRLSTFSLDLPPFLSKRTLLGCSLRTCSDKALGLEA